MSTLTEINSLYFIDEDTCVSNIVERVDSTVTYNDFFSKYLIRNKPCIISLQATENWPCRREWVLDGAPNFEVLRTLFGMWKITELCHTIVNIISIAQDIPLSQLAIVTESFTTRNSRMICAWKLIWNIGSNISKTVMPKQCHYCTSKIGIA